jgi:hypothetical protein
MSSFFFLVGFQVTYYIRVSFPFSNRKRRNSTTKTMIAVASDARKVEIETPSAVRPLPPVCSSASSKPEAMTISSGIAEGNGEARMPKGVSKKLSQQEASRDFLVDTDGYWK